jgi:hypothetical protein
VFIDENYLRPAILDLILSCAAQVMSGMQASFSGERGILPALSENGMESGKLDESGLSAGNNPAAIFDNSILDFFLYGAFYPVSYF